MNNILTVAVISVLAASILLIGASMPVFAQENMTMDNSTAPVQNTSEISDTGMGMDGNMMMGDMGDNMTGDNMTGDNMMMGDNMTGMQ